MALIAIYILPHCFLQTGWLRSPAMPYHVILDVDEVAITMIGLEGAVMSDRIKGIVKWFNNAKGFGFITHEGGEDVFVHFRSIRGDGYRTLTQGQQVEFALMQGPKGLHAEEVDKVEA